MPAAAGDIARAGIIEVVSRKTDATGVTKGDVVSGDANGLIEKAASGESIHDGLGVALETKGASTVCRCAVGNTWVYVTADGAIKPLKLVKVAATAGRVAAHSEPADAGAAYSQAEVNAIKNAFNETVGRYMGKEGEEEDMSDAAANDIICVRLGL